MARKELLLDGPIDLTPEIFHFHSAEELAMEACFAVEAVMGARGEIISIGGSRAVRAGGASGFWWCVGAGGSGGTSSDIVGMLCGKWS